MFGLHGWGQVAQRVAELQDLVTAKTLEAEQSAARAVAFAPFLYRARTYLREDVE